MGRGPYYSLKEAAHYCGYKSASYFRDLVRDYHIPAKGPNGNRYAEADLDVWMDNPHAFLEFIARPRPKAKRLHL